MVDELLATPHDFTVDEEMVIDQDAATYPKTPAEAQDRWRKRIKYDLLVLKADKTDGKPTKARARRSSKLQPQRYHSFAKRMHQTDSDELLEMYLTRLTTSFDPHTNYMSPEHAGELRHRDAAEAGRHRGLAAERWTATRWSTRSSPAARPTRTAG